VLGPVRLSRFVPIPLLLALDALMSDVIHSGFAFILSVSVLYAFIRMYTLSLDDASRLKCENSTHSMLSGSDVRLFRCSPALIGRVEVIIHKCRDPWGAQVHNW
jgi:hypothetical protein